MIRSRALISASVALALVGAAPSPISAARGPNPSCVALHRAYPTGLAPTQERARRTSVRGYQPPSIDKRAFAAAVRANPRLSTDGNSLCPVQAPPGPVQYLRVSATASARDGQPSILVFCINPTTGWPRFTYDFYVNGELVLSAQTKCLTTVRSLDYSTAYTVGVAARNRAGAGPVAERIVVTPSQDDFLHYGQERISYEVTGSSGSYAVTSTNALGEIVQADSVGNGVMYEAWFKKGDFVYVSAQTKSARGSVRCIIYKNGKTYKQTSSGGAYAIATCTGSA